MKVEFNNDVVDKNNYYIQLFDLAGADLDVDTDLFATKPYRFIGVVNTEGEDDLDMTDMNSIMSFLSSYVGGGNDGHLFWIPAKAAPHFADFARKFLIEAYEHDELNLNNGPISESFVLYHGTDGLVVAMIDPECGTSVFDTCIAKFIEEYNITPQYSNRQFDPTRAFNFEDCHLSSNLRIGRNDHSVDVFLFALQERGLIQELEHENQ